MNSLQKNDIVQKIETFMSNYDYNIVELTFDIINSYEKLLLKEITLKTRLEDLQFQILAL